MARRLFGMLHHVAGTVMAMVSLAAGLGVVSAASPAMAPSSAAPALEDVRCFRSLSDVIWGFLVTLLACTVAFWGLYKHAVSGKKAKLTLVFLAAFAPLYAIGLYISASFRVALMMWKYQKSSQRRQDPGRRNRYKTIWSLLSPFSKFPGRILFSSDVVVYAIKESSLLPGDWLWLDVEFVDDESEAMVIGEVAEGKAKDDDYERKELSLAGKLEFMLAGLVPKYDELKFLRGNSGFAVIAIAIQSLGYIYAVAFRTVRALPVAPLEVIGLILNILLLIEVSLFSLFNPCHRPLVIYMNSARDKKLLEALPSIDDRYVSTVFTDKPSTFITSVTCVCLCSVAVYFIVTLYKVSNILVVSPLIIFIVTAIIFLIDLFFELSISLSTKLSDISASLQMVAYTWALVVTIVHWKSQHFDAQAELLNISQLIPFIG